MKLSELAKKLNSTPTRLWDAWVCSEGYDEDGNEYDNLESWALGRKSRPQHDPIDEFDVPALNQ